MIHEKGESTTLSTQAAIETRLPGKTEAHSVCPCPLSIQIGCGVLRRPSFRLWPQTSGTRSRPAVTDDISDNHITSQSNLLSKLESATMNPHQKNKIDISVCAGLQKSSQVSMLTPFPPSVSLRRRATTVPPLRQTAQQERSPTKQVESMYRQAQLDFGP